MKYYYFNATEWLIDYIHYCANANIVVKISPFE
jgi:hypothetical protein